MKFKVKLLLFLFNLFISLPAFSVVIDFEDLPFLYPYLFDTPHETAGLGEPYEKYGYKFEYIPAKNEQNPTSLHFASNLWHYNTGSLSIFSNSDNSITKLTSSNNLGFDILSIDLAELNGPQDDIEKNVSFIGRKVDGQFVYQTFTLDGKTGFENFTFSTSFTRLNNLKWVQGNNITNIPHFFDNVELIPSSVVPLPPTAWLLGSALIGAAGLRRRYIISRLTN